MPVEEGLNTIAVLRGRSPRLTIVVCSFHHEGATKERALVQGAGAYLDKPVGADDLRGFSGDCLRSPSWVSSAGAEPPL